MDNSRKKANFLRSKQPNALVRSARQSNLSIFVVLHIET